MFIKTQVAFLFIVLSLVSGLASFPSVAVAQRRRMPDANVSVPRYLLAEAERVSGDRFRTIARTPAGVKVVAVSAPSRAMLDAIDDGFDNLFAAARRQGYRRSVSHRDYTVFIARSDRTMTDGAYIPAIAVGASQYAGTQYDRGGFIYAAGMVLDLDDNAFIIAEHTREFERASDAVRFEGEHLVLFHNDRRLFQATADHSRGGGHPILK